MNKKIKILTISLLAAYFTLNLYSQNQIRFFEALIEKGFFELATEWINEQLQRSSDPQYKYQLNMLLDTIKYKKLYTLPFSNQLKEFISFFNNIYNNKILKLLKDDKNFPAEQKYADLENCLIKFIDFLNYYDSSLKETNKTNLKLQEELKELVQNTISAVENIVKRDDIEDEIKQKFTFYKLILKFMYFKFTVTPDDPKISGKVSLLEKEFDNYYIEAQPAISAYEISLLKGKLYKILLEYKLARNDSSGINTLINKINFVIEEIYSKKESMEINKYEMDPFTTLIIRTILFKLDFALLQLKYNIAKDKNEVSKSCLADIDFILSFPYPSLKLEALFKKAQILEYTNNLQEAIPLYLVVAKSSSNFARLAQEALKRYQYSTTLSTQTEIFNELGRLISEGDYKKVWDFYTLYIRKRKFFTPKYAQTLYEMMNVFLTTNNRHLEGHILNYHLFKTLPRDEQNSRQGEIKLSNAILSLQDYINTSRESKGFFSELLNSLKTEFTAYFPKSDMTQSILLKDIKAKIQGESFNEALTLLKQTNWTNIYEKEANILQKYLEIKTLDKVTKSKLIEFIQTIKANAKSNLYLTSLGVSLFTYISFEKKQYRIAYRFLKYFLPFLSEDKEAYIRALEDGLKASYRIKKYKDFRKWARIYMQITTPSSFIIELFKNYAILSAMQHRRNTSLEFFNTVVMARKKNSNYKLQNEVSEKVFLINALSRATEYSTNLKDAPLCILVNEICESVGKENEKTIEKYLVSQKMIPKEQLENKFEKLKFIEAYMLLLQNQCQALKFRCSHDKNILEEMHKTTQKNKESYIYKTLARNTALSYFIALKKNIYPPQDTENLYKTYNAILKDIFARKFVIKDKPDKFSKEIILLSLYSSIYTQQSLDKVKASIDKYKPLLNLTDTRKLFKMVSESLPASKN